jgi:uncharacterized protein
MERGNMKSTEGKIGRVFVLRLEDGDMVPTCIEKFAGDKGIKVGQVVLIGGIGDGQVVVGPRVSGQMPPDPMLLPIEGAQEVVGVGIIAPNKEGKAKLHIHAAMGRAGRTLTGCLRYGAKTWLVGEVIIYEITGTTAKRMPDKASGFDLMEM